MDTVTSRSGAHQGSDDASVSRTTIKDNDSKKEELKVDGKENRTDVEKQKALDGEFHFHRLGWKRLTVILVAEAIALGSLSLPSAFAKLGMVAGVLCCIAIGLVAIYTSHLIGQVKLKFPHVKHYGEAMGLFMGRFGFELGSAMFIVQLILLVGSHCLTGTIAFSAIIQSSTCSVVYGVVSAAILFFLAIPPSFTEVAILAYIDFASILLAIGITMVAAGVKDHHTTTHWSAWPPAGTSFADIMLSLANIIFAYSFAMCQFSFMDEMHTIADYKKSIWVLGIIEIVIYTITGAVLYALIGVDVKSPALLSTSSLISRIVFGVALPVIFISGSINLTVAGRYVHGRLFSNSVARYVNTLSGWISWLVVLLVITILSFIAAETIPIFNDLLGICSSLFVSGFSFYLPPVMWFCLLKKGNWYSKTNIKHALMSALCFTFGIFVLACGTYASIVDIVSPKHELGGEQ